MTSNKTFFRKWSDRLWGEGNENWPSSHACQVAWGQSVPINVNEDWRHSAPCMIEPKPKAAFLIKIALPSSFPKGTLIRRNLLSLAVVSNWALLTSLLIIRWESEMCAHQLRDLGHFRGSPGLLPLATPHLLSYHPTSFQPQLHVLFLSTAWERDRQVGACPSPLGASFQCGLRACRDACGISMSHTVQAHKWERQDATCLEESEGSFLSPLLLNFSYQASSQVEAELYLLMQVSSRRGIHSILLFFVEEFVVSQTAFMWHTVIHFFHRIPCPVFLHFLSFAEEHTKYF